MIRLVLLILVLAAIALGAAWIADRPGELTMVWQGWRIETTVPVALAALAFITALMVLLWNLVSFLLRSPKILAAFSRQRREDKGWDAVSRGLLAIGAGNTIEAHKARDEASRLIPHEPLTGLLAAQAAQLAGDQEAALDAFRSMAEHPQTRLLGLRGLHMEARRAGDMKAARVIAEEAAKAAPTLGWAAEAVIEARCAEGDYEGARAVLERQMAQKGIDKTEHRRRRAVLLAAEAIALELGDPAVAKERALEAVRLAPTLVPAAAVAGRLLGAAGDMRKAAKVVETAYEATPHPELAEVEAHLRPGDAALDRLKRIRILAAKAPGHIESAIAIAHGAIDAQDFTLARRSLEPFLEAPSQRVCLLMAEIEAGENADIGKAREWTARAVHASRDPAWIADGIVSDHWEPISPVSGKLDAFVWAVPPGVSATPLLEHEADRVRAAIAAAGEKAIAGGGRPEALTRPDKEAPALAAPEAAASAQGTPGGALPAPPEGNGTIVDAKKDGASSSAIVSEARKEGSSRAVAAQAAGAASSAVSPEGTKAKDAAAEAKGAATPAEAAAALPAPSGDPQAAAGSSTAIPAARKADGRDKPAPIVAMPPLPDDPGPQPEEEKQQTTAARVSRFLGF